jgi:hypothetical protein
MFGRKSVVRDSYANNMAEQRIAKHKYYEDETPKSAVVN